MKISAEKPEERHDVSRGPLGGGLALRRRVAIRSASSFGASTSARRLARFRRPQARRSPARRSDRAGPGRPGPAADPERRAGPSRLDGNAAELAMALAGPYITFMVKDDHSSSDGAAQAAQSEVGDGAELIIGPVSRTTCAKRRRRPIGRPAGDRLFHRRPVATRRVSAFVPDRGLRRPRR